MTVTAEQTSDSTTPPAAAAGSGSALSPLKITVFRNIWLANLVSNLGTWMQDVGAGWLMTSLVPDPFMVSLVQVAFVLPGFLLTLPAGALADIVDRRLFMLWAILWMTSMAAGVGLITVTGLVTPWSLIAFTFGLGMGAAMMMPAFTSLIPDLVPRQELTAAITLNSIAMNITRAVGPAVAGILIAAAGPGPVFLINAVSFAGIFVVIFRYRSMQPRSTLPSERFFGALRVGLRFAAQSPALQAVIIRGAAFFSMMAGLFAFLPLIVREEVGAGPQAYGMLVTSMGVGAVAMGISLSTVRRFFASDTVLGAGTAIGVLALAGLAHIRLLPPLMFVMFLAGVAWICAVSTLQVAAQLALPAWVRARGMAIYIATFLGSMAVGSALWGRVASATSTSTALTVACVFGIVAGLLASRWRLSTHTLVDRTTAAPVSQPMLMVPDRPQDGPVMVNIEYRIEPRDAKAFEAAMRDVRRMRLRNGAGAWGLYQDTEDEYRYVESFIDATWLDHLRHMERHTVEDMEFKRVAEAFHQGTGPPKVRHHIARSAPKRRRSWFGGKPTE